MGKSALAEKFAMQLKLCSFVWWVRADSEENFDADLTELAEKLALFDTKDMKPREVVAQLVSTLSQRGRLNGWLLVFDNLEVESARYAFSRIPTHGGAVLLTSRVKLRNFLNDEPGREEELFLETGPLSVEDAVQLLEVKSKNTKDEGFKIIVERLGRLPLAINQAGAIMQQRSLNSAEFFSQVLQNLQTTDDFAAISSTFRYSIDAIFQSTGQDTLNVLQTLAYLAPDNIPLAFISAKSSSELNPAEQKTVEHLVDYSVITYSTERKLIGIHRLMQAAARDILTPETFANCIAARDCVIQLTEKLVSLLEKRDETLLDVERRRGLIPHAETLWSNITSMSLSNNVLTAKFLRLLGLALADIGNPEKQRLLLDQALEIFRLDSTKYVEEISLCHEDYGDAFQSQQQASEALQSFQNARLLLGPLSSSEKRAERLAKLEDKLGVAFYHLGDIKEAVHHHREAVGKFQALNKPIPPEVQCNLGNAYRLLGQLKDAQQHLDDALLLAKSINGEGHPQYAKILNDLGYLYMEQSEDKLALRKFEEALDFRERFYGPNHLFVATTKSNLAYVHTNLGNYDKAAKFLEESERLYSNKFKADHPRLAHIIFYQGYLDYEQHKFDAAIAKYTDALGRFKILYNETNVDYGVALLELGKAYQKVNKKTESIARLRSALVVFESVYTSKEHKNLKMCHRLLDDTTGSQSDQITHPSNSMDSPPTDVRSVEDLILKTIHHSVNALKGEFAHERKALEIEVLQQREWETLRQELSSSRAEVATMRAELASVRAEASRIQISNHGHTNTLVSVLVVLIAVILLKLV